MFQIAHRMFSRWRQENFFRYMRHEFALDHLCTHGQLVGRRVLLTPGETLRVKGRILDEDQVDELLRQREGDIERLKARRDALPTQVPLDHIIDAEHIVQLERERKLLTDAVKMIAYRAESYMARWVEPFFARHQDEARKLLQIVFQATADLLPDPDRKTLTVRFHGLSSPRATRALADLCEIFTTDEVCYPGTDLRLRFEAPECHTN
jgi:hypothetical protein